MSKFTVGELINELEKIDKDKTVRVSVLYDDCEHMQYLTNVYVFEGLNWITLTGGEFE